MDGRRTDAEGYNIIRPFFKRVYNKEVTYYGQMNVHMAIQIHNFMFPCCPQFCVLYLQHMNDTY